MTSPACCTHLRPRRIVGAHGYDVQLAHEGDRLTSDAWVEAIDWCPGCGAIRNVLFNHKPGPWRLPGSLHDS